MKKITFISILLILSGFVIAQQAICPPFKVGKNNFPISNNTTKVNDFLEDFESGAVGMTTVNVDGNSDDLTHTQGINFSAGWLMQLSFGSGYFAASNSVFSPAGACDRWMFTPQIMSVSNAAELSWDAATLPISATQYAADYQIYVTTSIAGANPAPSDFSTLLTTITDEPWATAFTHRTADLSAYAGQNIWIAFRHVETTSDGTLGIDNIRVGSSINDDIVMATTFVHMGMYGGYYGSIPTSQIQPFLFGADVLNFGGNAQTNIILNANVNNGLFNDNSTPYASLAGGANDSIYTQNVFIPSVVPNTYECIISIDQNETDENPGNNSDTVSFETTDSYFSRGGAITTYCGLGSYGGATAVVGANYHFAVAEQIDTLWAFIADGSPAGATVTLKIYDVLNSNAEVAATSTYTITATDETNGAFIQLPLTTPYTTTADGLYTIGGELGGTGASSVEFYGDNYNPNPGTAVFHYLNHPTNGWGWYYFIGAANVPLIGCILHTIVSVNEIESELEVNIYPNPTTGILNISNTENANVIVYNMVGEVVLSLKNVSKSINVSGLAEGTYVIKVVSENNVSTHKISLLK